MHDVNVNEAIFSNPGTEISHVFNVLLVGDKGVGKTVMANTIANKKYNKDADYVPTKGINFYFRTMFVDGHYVKLQLWDTAGDNKFLTHINERHFKTANCIVLVYDISRQSTFTELQIWLKHVKKNCETSEVIIVGNKSDLPNCRRLVSKDEGLSSAKQFNFAFTEISSHEQKSVERLFLQLARAMTVAALRRQHSQQQSKSVLTPPLKQRLPQLFRLPFSSPKKKPQPNHINSILRSDCDALFKVLLVGEAAVGKTSLMQRYVHKKFSEEYCVTLGIDFEAQIIDVDGWLIKLQLWDTCGQEKFRALSPQYYRGADAVIVVYDVTSRHSFDSVLSWVQCVKLENSGETVVAVVGNKSDVGQNRREVDEALGVHIAKVLNVDMFLETSAKSSDNVGELFEKLTRLAIAKKNVGESALAKRESCGKAKQPVLRLHDSYDAGKTSKDNKCC